MVSRAEEHEALRQQSLWGDFGAVVANGDTNIVTVAQGRDELLAACSQSLLVDPEAAAVQPSLWRYLVVRRLEQNAADFDQFRHGFEEAAATHPEAFHLEAPFSPILVYFLRQWYFEPDVTILACNNGDKFLGAVAVSPDKRLQSEYEIGFLFRSELASGFGLGRQLLREAIYTVLQSESVASVRLTVAPENEHAHALYRTAGFVEAGPDNRGHIVMRLGTREEMWAAIRVLEA